LVGASIWIGFPCIAFKLCHESALEACRSNWRVDSGYSRCADSEPIPGGSISDLCSGFGWIQYYKCKKSILYLFFSAFYVWRVYKTDTLTTEEGEDLRSVFKEFKNYCSPLVIYTGVGFLYSFADYWLLQKFGGAVQQGYYAIGARFAALSLIATTSILQVFWKEIAEANSLGKMERVRLLYYQVSRSLYFIAAVISCVMIPFSQEILALFLGPSYQAAWLPLSLMFLYPIHQSMGQITGTMLMSMGRTKAQSYIGIFFMVISIPTAYILLATKSATIPGFQLGAMGLAMKMVMCQILGVNLSAFFVARYINAHFDWSHQIYFGYGGFRHLLLGESRSFNTVLSLNCRVEQGSDQPWAFLGSGTNQSGLTWH